MQLPVTLPQGPGASIPGAVTLKIRRKRVITSAFTLVEVVISLGISSFAIIGMMGLMALGLTTLRQSMDYNTETVIAQKLNGEAQMLNFSSVTNATSAYRVNFANNRYFDEAGGELANTPTPPTAYVYMATLVVQPCRLPGMTANSSVAEEMVIKLSTPSKPGSVSSYNNWAVDNGR